MINKVSNTDRKIVRWSAQMSPSDALDVKFGLFDDEWRWSIAKTTPQWALLIESKLPDNLLKEDDQYNVLRVASSFLAFSHEWLGYTSRLYKWYSNETS